MSSRAVKVVIVTLVIGAIGAGGAGASATNPKYSGSAIMNHKGFTAQAKARTSSLARVRIRFDSGVLVKVARSPKSQIYAGYSILAGGVQYFGNLTIPPGRSTGRFQLNAEGQPGQLAFRGVTAFITTGRRPVIVISGFPAGATAMSMQTAGPGTAATRLVAPCKDRQQKATGSMLISLASGATEPGLVDNGLFCGKLP